VPQIEPSLAGKRCLVLDDEFLIALDIQQILETAGAASVKCFASAAECIAALEGGARYDLAVLDFLMAEGGGNSLSVATLLQEQGAPFVFVTGMRSWDIRSADFPDAPVVEKPYEIGILLDAVSRALA
jgi:CheY-like chemotaxis protein